MYRLKIWACKLSQPCHKSNFHSKKEMLKKKWETKNIYNNYNKTITIIVIIINSLINLLHVLKNLIQSTFEHCIVFLATKTTLRDSQTSCNYRRSTLQNTPQVKCSLFLSWYFAVVFSLSPSPFFPFTSLRLHIIHVCTSNWFSGAYRSIYAHVYAHPSKHWKSWQKIYFLFIFWKWLINFLHYIGLC